MSAKHDAVVIGAGHNGLTCACYLARAGLDVLVLEQHETIGGMTATEELAAPGFWSDVHASGYQLANISPVPVELGLFDLGLELIEPEFAWAHAFSDGRSIAVAATSSRCTRPSRPSPGVTRTPPSACFAATSTSARRSSARCSRRRRSCRSRWRGWSLSQEAWTATA